MSILEGIFITFVISLTVTIIVDEIKTIIKIKPHYKRYIMFFLVIAWIIIFVRYFPPIEDNKIRPISEYINELIDSEDTKKPILLYLYPLKYDYTQYKATQKLQGILINEISSKKNEDYILSDNYSFLLDGSEGSKRIEGNIEMNTILRITGTLSEWKHNGEFYRISDICLEKKVDDNHWSIIEQVKEIRVGENRHNTNFPKIHDLDSFDDSKKYISNGKTTSLCFKTVTGINGGDCIGKKKCKEESFNQALLKIDIDEAKYRKIKKICVEKEQNRYYTYVTIAYKN